MAFGNYELLEELGRGGAATVWRARHRFLGTEHALKVMDNTTQASPERLLIEGRVQAQLRHPHIVPVTDIVSDGEQIALAMPLLSGGTLWSWIFERGPLAPDDALEVFGQVLDAVAFAHSAGVLHRDLKPENVLLESGSPRIADFGIARLARDEDDPEITEIGVPMGTLGYVAPEQWASGAEVDERADIFSLGALLYTMICARKPFDDDDPTGVLANTLAGRHPDLRRLAPDCPDHVALAVHRCLRPHPRDRYQSCSQLAEALGIALTHTSPPESLALRGGPRRTIDSEGLTPDSLAPFHPAELADDDPPEAQPAGDGPTSPTLMPRPPGTTDLEFGAAMAGGPADVFEAVTRPARSAERTTHLPRPSRGGSTLAILAAALCLGGIAAAAGAVAGAWLYGPDTASSEAMATGEPTVEADPVDGEEQLEPSQVEHEQVDSAPVRRVVGDAHAAARPDAVTPAPEPAEAAVIDTSPDLCPTQGDERLGWITVLRKHAPKEGRTLRIRGASAVHGAVVAHEDGPVLSGAKRCTLYKGERLELRSAALAGEAEGTWIVEVYSGAVRRD